MLRTHIRQERSEYTSFSMLEKAETETTHGACFGFFVTYFRRDEVKRAGVRCNKETASRTVIKSAHFHTNPLKNTNYSHSRIFFLSGNTIAGDTDSSSSPIFRNSSVSSRSAPSSPQIPIHFPSACALSAAILIIASTAG